MDGKQPPKHLVPIDPARTGRRIRQFMRLLGVTPADVCGHLYLSSLQSVYNWFSGRSLPAFDNLYGLSQLLGVPMNLLVCCEAGHGPAGERLDSMQRIRTYAWLCAARGNNGAAKRMENQ